MTKITVHRSGSRGGVTSYTIGDTRSYIPECAQSRESANTDDIPELIELTELQHPQEDAALKAAADLDLSRRGVKRSSARGSATPNT